MILIGSFLCLIPFDWVKQKSAQAIAQVYNIYVAHHRYFKKIYAESKYSNSIYFEFLYFKQQQEISQQFEIYYTSLGTHKTRPGSSMNDIS